MIKSVSFTSEIRASVLLCCSASVLLAGCGGGGTEPGVASSQAPQFAAVTYNGTLAVADLYVSPGGADTNAGTQAAPFKTIARAAQAATPGVTVRVAPGTYEGGIKSTVSGTAEARIRFLSSTPGGAKIVPPATSASSIAWENRGSYVDIEGFEVDGTAVQAGTKWANGIYTAGSFSTIKNNHVHHIGKTLACAGSGGGIGSDSYYKGASNDVLGNAVHDVGPAACALFFGIYINTADSKVQNNLVYNVSEAGVRLWHDAARNTVSNNTVFNTGIGVLVGGDGGYISVAPNDYTKVSNNILVDNARYGVQELGSTGTHNTYTNNIVFRAGTYTFFLNNGLVSTGTKAVDPLLANYVKTGGGDYRPLATSPAVNAAVAADAPSTDLFGAARDASTGYDIGAIQHLAGSTPPPPPLPPPSPDPDPTPDPVDPTPIPKTTYNYYVSPSGSDTAAGTQAAPYRTIAKAASRALPSTTIWVAPGTYTGGFKTTLSGTASARIYYVSTTKWGAKIVPPASSANDTAWDNRGNYVDIVGFEINGTAVQSGTKWTHGIYTGGSYGMIRNNRIHHIATTSACTSAGGSAIGVDSYYHGVKTDVVGNLVHDIGPAGCRFIQGIYVSTSGSVKNNVVYRVAEAAIHLWHDATNVIITNNTVAASNTGIIVGGGDFYYTSGGNNNTAVYNNIVYDNKYGISEQGSTGTSNTYRNNLVYQNTYNWTLRNGLTHTGTVSAVPQFVSYTRTGTPDLHIAAASPAVGKGTATNALPYDFDNKPRNSTTGFDIGAYQH
jgi:parallel beta-helix repeat protein